MMEIHRALDANDCDVKDLEEWCKEINAGFSKDNFESLTLEYMEKINPGGSHKRTLIDQRSVIDVVQDFANAADRASIESCELHRECKRLRTEQNSVGRSLDELGKEQILLKDNLKLCVEQQITTNKKVDRMEKIVISMNDNIGDMKNLLLSYFVANPVNHEKGENFELSYYNIYYNILTLLILIYEHVFAVKRSHSCLDTSNENSNNEYGKLSQ